MRITRTVALLAVAVGFGALSALAIADPDGVRVPAPGATHSGTDTIHLTAASGGTDPIPVPIPGAT